MRTVRALTIAVLAAGLLAAAPAAPAGADASDAPGAPEGFRSLSAGDDHSCLVEPSGGLRCWGTGGRGRLGQGSTDAIGDEPGEVAALTPIDLGTGRTVAAVSAGHTHTCAVLDNGQVKCWGDNGHGRLGLGDTNNRGDEPGEMGDNLPAVALGTGRTATAVVANEGGSCALLDNGQVKCWGRNNFGQLGRGDTNDRGDQPGEMGNNLPAIALGTGRTATAISSRGFSVCALLDNGRVKCWGDNNDGELGLGNIDARGDEPGEMGNNLPAVPLGIGRTVTAISAGREHMCAILDTDDLKCWGRNAGGRLGLGDTVSRGNEPGEMGNNLPVVDLGGGLDVVGVAADWDHACALLDDGNVKCWGDNFAGALGISATDDRGDETGEMGDDLPYADIGGPVLAVTTATTHSCALLTDLTVKCWGGNAEGNLGLGDTENRTDEPGEGGSSLPAVPLIPTNDAFAAGRSISGAVGSLADTNANAVDEVPDEPLHGGLVGTDSSVWYSWNAPATGPVTIDTSGSTFDTVLAVYTGATLSGLTGVIAGDDTDTAQSQVQFTATGGTTYRIAVTGKSAGYGRIALNWRLALPCNGQPVTVPLVFGITPTAGPDVIRGTVAAETINGLGGDDVICAGGGGDTVNSGAGDDTVFGEGGNDILRGGADDDTLNGGSGNDRLIGDAGSDRLAGGPQRDTCSGGPQVDTQTGCEVRTSIP